MPGYGCLCDVPMKYDLSAEGLWHTLYETPIHFGECEHAAVWAVCFREEKTWHLVAFCDAHFEAMKELHPEAEGVRLKDIRVKMVLREHRATRKKERVMI